jgi:hypothetical protein
MSVFAGRAATEQVLSACIEQEKFMAIVVVGGHSRSVGKTSVMAGLIAALPAYNWTAFKVTQFGHGRCSLDGKPCHCASEDRCWAISEEKDEAGRSDSARFLAAGARRSFWVRTEQGRLGEAMPAIERKLAAAENAMLESNSILQFIEPDIYISVLDPAIPDFKNSARRFLERADAVVLHARHCPPQWDAILPPQPTARPIFGISPPPYVNDELVRFVEGQLRKSASECRP